MVEPQNLGLTPTSEEVEHARRVVAHFNVMDERGEVEGVMSGATVDAYEAERARELIEWASLCGLRDAEKASARRATEIRLNQESAS